MITNTAISDSTFLSLVNGKPIPNEKGGLNMRVLSENFFLPFFFINKNCQRERWCMDEE